jgi:hypothetical protein
MTKRTAAIMPFSLKFLAIISLRVLTRKHCLRLCPLRPFKFSLNRFWKQHRRNCYFKESVQENTTTMLITQALLVSSMLQALLNFRQEFNVDPASKFLTNPTNTKFTFLKVLANNLSHQRYILLIKLFSLINTWNW